MVFIINLKRVCARMVNNFQLVKETRKGMNDFDGIK